MYSDNKRESFFGVKKEGESLYAKENMLTFPGTVAHLIAHVTSMIPATYLSSVHSCLFFCLFFGEGGRRTFFFP